MTADLTLSTTRVTQRAWFVLGLAFLVFALIVTSVTSAAYGYIQSAMVERDAILETAGEVLVQPYNEASFRQARRGERIQEGDTIKTQGGVQARLALFDGSTLQLAENTTVELGQMRASRFVAGQQQLGLILREGWGRLLIPPAPNAPARRLRVLLPALEVEATSQDDQPTRLSLEARPAVPLGSDPSRTAPAEARVTVEDGVTTVRSGTETRTLTSGEKVAMVAGDSLGPVTAGLHEYIRNGDFSVLAPARENDVFPRFWETTANQGGDGGDRWGDVRVLRQVVDGKPTPTISLIRRVGAQDHASVGFAQPLNLPLSHFKSLRLHVRLQVEYQSLSGGGMMESEYPVIVKVTYRDKENRIGSWYHGFYTENPLDFRVNNGTKVAPGAWHDFTQDLLALDINPAPAFIETLDIYAAGHDFQSAIAFVSVLGE